jgi:hypothetical protein
MPGVQDSSVKIQGLTMNNRILLARSGVAQKARAVSASKGCALAIVGVILGGCGLLVPEMEEFYQPQSEQQQFENIVVNNVKCELALAVRDAEDYYKTGLHNDVSWFNGWGATVTLKLTVDEKSALNPGVSLTNFYPNKIIPFPTGGNITAGQSFTATLGATSSADGTRIETITFSYRFTDLVREYKNISSCSENENGVFIQSNLKIKQFIFDKLFIASVPGTTLPKGNASPFTAFNYEVTFVAAYGGNATPTWKFARVTADPSSPLFSATRTKTHDLTITLGDVANKKGSAPPVLSTAAQDAHFAAMIGQAVATAIQSQTH